MEKRKIYALFRRTANFPHVRRSLFLLQWLSVGECKRVMLNQEEVDPRLLPHSHHVSRNRFHDIMVHTPDTDVFLLMLSLSNEIAGKLYRRLVREGKPERSTLQI